MSTVDEQLATALIAKMAGSTLFDIDQNTISQSSAGPATKIDPKKFLPGVQQIQQQRQEALIQHAQKMAEQLAPLPASPVVPQTVSQEQPQTFTGQDPNQLTFDFLDEATQKKSLKQLDLVVDYLYSINNKLDRILNSVSKNSNK